MKRPLVKLPALRALVCLTPLLLAACTGETQTAPLDGSSGGTPFEDPTSGGSGGRVHDIVVQGGSGGEPTKQCERKLRLDAVTVTAPEPFDVIIVADHSGSLAWSKDDLASGLSNFLEEVRGFDVRFFVLTPTQYGASSEDSDTMSGYARVGWQDPVTELPFEDAMTTYSETCVDSSGQSLDCPDSWAEVTVGFTQVGSWSFQMPEPVATITADMTDPAFFAEQVAVTDAILNLGLNGSSDEQPACTLSRYIRQAPELLPDNAVFLLLTDEDDDSDPAACVSELRAEVDDTVEHSVVELKGVGLHSQRLFNCTPIDDQGQVAGSPVPQLYNLGSCTSARACNSSDLQAALSQCPVQHIVEDCRITCEEAHVRSCSIEDTGIGTAACTSAFQYGGQTYDNLVDYCSTQHPEILSWDSCRAYVKESNAGETAELIPLVPGSTVLEMVQDFRTKADAAFGPDSYSVELISFQPQFSCTPQAGQSDAITLSSLVSSPEHLFPICGDYTGALGKVTSFAAELIRTDYEVALEPGEDLEGVRVTGGDGTERTLMASDYSYDPVTQLLLLKQEALFPTDLGLEVDVREACIVK